MKRITLEVFAETLVGTSFGVIGSIFFNFSNLSIFITAIISGLIGKLLISKLFSLIESRINAAKKKKVKKHSKVLSFQLPEIGKEQKTITSRLIFFKRYAIIILLIIGIGGVMYCTIDTNFKGDVLSATTTLKIKENYGPGGNVLTVIQKNDEVVYLDRMWRKYRFKDRGDKKIQFDFWVKVRTKDGVEGWTYGSYLN